MAELLLHHKGGWNIFCTVSDGPYWVPALTLVQLKDWYRGKYGSNGMSELQPRLDRAQVTGCSSMIGQTIASCINMYRKVHKRTMTDEEFIQQFLTLPEPREPMGLQVEEDEVVAVRFCGIDPLNIGAGAVQPMLRDSWRFAFLQDDDGTLRFCYSDTGPLVAYAATDASPQRVEVSDGAMTVLCEAYNNLNDWPVDPKWVDRWCEKSLPIIEAALAQRGKDG